MAQVAVQNVPATPSFHPINPIIRDTLAGDVRPSVPMAFDADKHLSYKDEPKKLSMKDLGLPEDTGISPVAVSEPFPLFTEDAIRAMRSEIFSREVWENCLHSTEFASCQLRGYAPRYAPFIYDAWNDPKTLSIVSQIAGIDLVPVFDIEIGNINVSVKDENSAESKLKLMNQSDDDLPITKWHHDSYPFVCVVMMSDATNMIGGETALRTGTGDILKVRGPQMGCAVVLQGRYISHQALGAIGGSERITMVTSFRPRDPLVKHTSGLTNIRPITNLSDLYYQWTEYRLNVLQGRLSGMLQRLSEEHRAGKKTDVEKLKEYLQEQEEWLAGTNAEILKY